MFEDEVIQQDEENLENNALKKNAQAEQTLVNLFVLKKLF